MNAQQLLDLARKPLNDEGKVRYKDSDLLGFLNAGLAYLKRKRPDLFLGSLHIEQMDLGLADPLPTPSSANQALADYVTARGNTVDAEFGESRVAAFIALAEGQL